MSEPKTGTEASLPPILCTIRQAAAMIARGETFIYGAIAGGQLEAVKSDKRTLIKVASVQRYVDQLPPAEIKPFPSRLRRQRA
jgi:hypothetical protein